LVLDFVSAGRGVVRTGGPAQTRDHSSVSTSGFEPGENFMDRLNIGLPRCSLNRRAALLVASLSFLQSSAFGQSDEDFKGVIGTT
jgi:hypothetical protein